MTLYKSINISMEKIGRRRKSDNSSVEILNYPGRKWQILRKFHFILPKFYFILPKFYFTAPWRIFICSLEISDFLGRRVTAGGGDARPSVPTTVTRFALTQRTLNNKTRGRNRSGLYPILICRRAMPLPSHRLKSRYLTYIKNMIGFGETTPYFCS